MAALSPSDTARAFFQALERGDWVGAAALADPEWVALNARRQIGGLAVMVRMEELERARAPGEDRGSGALAQIPEDSTAVAELAQRYGHHRWKRYSGGEVTLAELAALTPTQLLALQFEGLAAFRAQSSRWPSWQILGEVTEGDSLAFVVCRAAGLFTSLSAADAHILHMRRTPEGWRCRLDHNGIQFGLHGILVLWSGPEPTDT